MKLTLNPVGNFQMLDRVEGYLDNLIAKWKLENPPSSWWRVWSKAKIGFVTITAFLINGLDELIQIVEDAVDVSGPDKKATVIKAITRVYDFVIKEAMPMWLRPFSPAIKNFIINVVISYAVDFIVEKYNNGNWLPPIEKPVEKPVEEIVEPVVEELTHKKKASPSMGNQKMSAKQKRAMKKKR